ncbi:hypothetical protein, variant [Aphanomyces astaci]|uniref:FYVE-type domain-containing protein n=1 Tax=Aphanomyces astaci TaxID=112090 RepID=W4HA93_APHAT|nr:hypothetical protein, variant [Aphanomyces astaci]ETV88486.1 hypothetical protein, variant [Aphanomyces astaci]|eukprot:XP_009820886.1 hypothetical protein, variant [Aphanomyces astaci]
MIPAPHSALSQAPMSVSRTLYLTDAQQTDIYHQSRNHAVSFLQNSLSDLHEWEFISEKKSVQFYRKKSNDGTTYTINGITRIVADLDETMRTLYCDNSTSLSDLFSQLHDDAFADGAVLAALPGKRDPSGICREQCSIKTLSFRPFNAMDKARQYTVVDYCTIRTGKTDEGGSVDATDNRLGIQLMYSTDAADPASASSRRLASSSLVHGASQSTDAESNTSASQLLPSGFIVYPTAKKGVLEVIFSWSAHDPRGISRGYKKSILSLVASVARLENIFLALRIAAAGFIKSKNWVSDKERSYCFICRESFGAFRRRHHCRLCGDITCSKCGTLTAVKLPVVGLCQVRICMRCLTENDSSRINVSLPPSTSSGVGTGPRSTSVTQRSSAGSQQLQVMERLSHGMSNLSAVPTQHQIDSDEDEDPGYGSLQSSTVLGGSSSMDSSLSSTSSYMGGSFQHSSLNSSSRLAYTTNSGSGIIDEDDETQYRHRAGSNEGVQRPPPPPRRSGGGAVPLPTLSASTQLTHVKQFSYPLHYTDGQLWPLAPIPTEEASRLRKLDDLAILDTPQEQEYNHIAQSAAEALHASFGFISFIDAKREWVKASYGNGAGANTSIARDVSLSAHVIMSYEVTVVPNMTADVRFRDNPLVLDGIKLRSFVGYPLVTSDGFIVGVLGVADTRVRPYVE